MARSRKNAGVIGKIINAKPFSKSGTWSIDDSYLIRSPEKQNIKRSVSNRLDENPFIDDYHNATTVQISDIHYDDHIMKDKGDYGWDEYYAALSYTRPLAAPVYTGPRYRDWCTKFNENSGYSVADYASLRFGTSAFTIEFWIKLERYDSTEQYVISKGTLSARTSGGTGWTVYVSTTRTIGFYDGLSNVSIVGSTSLVMDQWYHVAVVRSSTGTNDTRIYVDGALHATGTSTGNFTDTNAMRINYDRAQTTSTCFSGRLTDIRLSNTAVYSTTFTAPSAALTMTGANTVFSHSMLKPHHDNIPGNHAQGAAITMIGNTADPERVTDTPFFVRYPKLTGHGSHCLYQWPGNGNYKIYEGGPNSTSLRLGTNPFTVECWVKPAVNGLSNGLGIAGKGTGNAGAGTGWSFRVDGSGYLVWDDGATTLTQTLTSSNVRAGGWYHVAAVREGTGTNQFKMYVNGLLVYTGTVATNYTESNEFRVFNTRADQYSFGGFACGLRISNVAKYTANSNIETTTFIDNSMTSTWRETLLLVATTGSKPPRPFFPGPVNVGYAALATIKRGNEFDGGKKPFSPKGASFNTYTGASNQRIVAVEGNSSFQFSTGDFSIEFWFQNRYAYDGPTIRRTLLDTRSSWSDTGISIDIGTTGALSVHSGGRALLNDTYNVIRNGIWHHVCLQRVNGQLALYVDGVKIQEIAHTASMSSGAAKLTLLNQTSSFSQNLNPAAFISDVRIVKGSAAYAVNNKNPSSFSIPTEPLPEITNTVFLLSAKYGIFKDTATGSTNIVTSGGRAESDFTSAWSVFASSQGPYLGNGSNRENYIYGDTSGGTTGGGWSRGHLSSGSSNRSHFVWMNHLVKPWTIDAWIHPNNTNPATPGSAQFVIQTADATGREGWQLVTHFDGTRTNSWGNICFSLFTQHNNGVQNLGTTITNNNPNLRPHGWNHIAVVFDPTKTNKLAIWANGERVAASTGFATPGQKAYSYDDLQYNNYISNVRISDIARYNNDATTYTIPQTNWTVDANTAYQATWDGPVSNLAGDVSLLTYGGSISYKNKKFGVGSWKFSNKESSLCDRITFYRGDFYSMGDTNWYGDFTFECWAQWFDAAAGGKDFFATYGNTLFHYANEINIGVSPTGNWVFKFQGGGGTTPSITQWSNTNIACATTTSQRWDHVVMTRRQGNFYFYINGVWAGTLLNAAYGTPTGLGTNWNSSYEPNNRSDPVLGCDYTSANTTGWSGFVQDVRFTHLARYDTGEANTMIHIGTNTPALPKDILPSSYNPVTSTVGSMFIYGNSAGGNPYYYTEPNSNLTLDGDWTIEFFVERNGKYSGTRDIILGSLNGDWGIHFGNYIYTNRFSFYANAFNTGGENFSAYDSSVDTGSASFSEKDQQWYHVAITRSNTVLKIYVNGIESGSRTLSGIAGVSGSSQTQWVINNTVNGHLSSIRFTKSVVYTGNFTPPSNTLTALANTHLLIHPFTADKKVIDYSNNKIDITYSSAANNITISAAGPFGSFEKPYLP